MKILRLVTSISSSRIGNIRLTRCKTILSGNSTRRTLLVLLQNTSKTLMLLPLAPFELLSEPKVSGSKQGVEPQYQIPSLRLFKKSTQRNGPSLTSTNIFKVMED